ncbi:Cupredoxin [Dichotomocladium elegans]|nr:Cupredoxin [Dichotomocladium elegans]
MLHIATVDALKQFDLNITLGQISPDCSDYMGEAVLVNEQLPGPAIIVNQGDRVRVTVRNFLPPSEGSNITGAGLNDVAVHFHGIRQYGSSYADGVPLLTQMPIPPGGEFIHEFRVINQAGTFFYHAHIGLQEQTVFGPFIVQENESDASEKYDDEHIISLSEWWHVSRTSLEEYMLGPQFKIIPEAQSVLINGRTLYNINMPSSSSKCAGYSVIPVEHGKTYRLRVIGATIFRTLGFGIASHNLTIIEVDGEPVRPYSVEYLEVAPGQRFSVLLHASQISGDYTIGTNRRWAEGVSRGSNGMALLSYDAAHGTDNTYRLPPNQPNFPVDEVPQWIWPNLQPKFGVDPIVHKTSSRTIKLRATDQKMEDGTRQWYINGIAFAEPKRPILTDLAQGRRRHPTVGGTEAGAVDGYDPYLGTYPIEYYEIVDFVLQSTHVPGEPCRTHPWHTHGHSHWEIANGPGEYNEARDGLVRNIPHPIQKDITLIYPQIDPDEEIRSNNTLATDQVGCGWAKIRILADNPGIWAMHCHNSPHMIQGMMIILEEAPELISFPQNFQF